MWAAAEGRAQPQGNRLSILWDWSEEYGLRPFLHLRRRNNDRPRPRGRPLSRRSVLANGTAAASAPWTALLPAS